VEKTEGCWNWLGYVMPNGYGTIRYNGDQLLVHRLIWLVYYGEMPPADLLVCHSCDNRRCVRKEHLFLGTYADNSHDAQSKGRLVGNRGKCFGETHGRAKLTWDKVMAIRAANTSLNDLAREYGVTRTMIGYIRKGKFWPESRAPK